MSFLKVNEFANQLNVSRATASKMLQKLEYANIKKGNKYIIPDSSIYMKGLKEQREEAIEAGNDELKNITFMFVNNKGGTGKTISTTNVSASLAFFGYKVLVVDMDPQSNSSSMNQLKDENNNFKDKNIMKIMNELDEYGDETLISEIRETIVSIENECIVKGKLDLIPNSLDWDDKVEPLIYKTNSANYLDMILSHIKQDYDFVVIDTGPSLDILWRQAVIASDSIVVSIKMEEDSIEGLSGVYKRIYNLNPVYRDRKKKNIEVAGAVAIDYNERYNYTKANVEEIKEILENTTLYNESILFEPYISRTIKASELQSGSRIGLFDEPSNKITDEYLQLSANIATQLFSTKGL